MRPYDHSDFTRNGGKFALYRTARVARHVHTENGADDLVPGEFVGVEFFRVARNQLYRRDEPVYTVTKNGRVWGMVYANALSDFVL